MAHLAATPATRPGPLPFLRPGSGLPAGDLLGNRDVPGAKSAKNHSKNSKKARSAFLFYFPILRVRATGFQPVCFS